MSDTRFEATLNQAGLYAIHTLGGDWGASSNICFQAGYEGPFDRRVFQEAFARVSELHESFRAAFVLRGRTLTVELAPRALIPVVEHDLRGLDDVAQRARLEALMMRDAARPVPLDVAPLARVQVVRLGPNHGQLLFCIHHAVVDGGSVPVFWPSLARAYGDVAEGRPASGTPGPDQLSAIAAFERAALARGDHDALLERWRRRLEGTPQFPVVPLASVQGPRSSLFGIEAAAWVPPTLVAKVSGLARRHGVTPFVVLMAAVKVLVHTRTLATDLVTFSTFANRKRFGKAVGYLVNTLPLRDRLDPAAGFDAFVAEVASSVKFARESAEVPSALVARRAFSPSAMPPFPLMNVIIDSPPAEYDVAMKMAWGPVQMWLATNRSPLAAHLSVSITPHEEGTKVTFRVPGQPSELPGLERLAQGFSQLLGELLEDPTRPVRDAGAIGAAERAALARMSHGAPAMVPSKPVPEWVASELAKHPSLVAWVGQTRRTGLELEQAIARAAGVLRAAGARAGGFVLIAAAGEPAALGVLAALRLGSPWVCVDASQGEARAKRALETCRPAVVLADAAGASLLSGLGVSPLPIERLESSEGSPVAQGAAPAPSALAYAILTSGSTGEPRLVAISHRALSAQLAALLQHGLFGPQPAIAQLAPLTFDASLEQLLIPLISGGRVVHVPLEERGDPERVWSRLVAGQVTVLDAVPSLARALLPSAPANHALERFVLGGEPLATELVVQLKAKFPERAIFDTYGPTETTINATVCERDEGPANIGRPLPGFRAFVVDDALRELPIGFIGQLALAGPCLAQGYLGDAAATAKAFVASPLVPEGRLYLTGDRARWTEAGTLQLFGRSDTQVKLRGVRVDLHEVEQALRECPGIEEAAVVLRERHGRALLVAAYTCRAEPPDEAALRGRLAAALPKAMVPEVLLALDALPRLANGKLDRAAIQAPTTVDVKAPEASSREALLCALMSTALGGVEVGPEDDFFVLGGDSLSALSFLTGVRSAGIKLSAEDLRECRSPRGLLPRCTELVPEEAMPPTLQEARDAASLHPGAFSKAPKKVLLTGANGLYGLHVLQALLARGAEVICVVRASDDATARERLAAAWAKAFPGQKLDGSKARAIRGDLSVDGLGFSAAGRLALQGVDCVLHNGAKVAWVAPQAELEAANVHGTRRMAQLARTLGASLEYVSTASVVNVAARKLPYVESKVRAEQVVLRAGVPSRIWRVGLLSGRASDGHFPVVAGESGLLLLLSAALRNDFTVPEGSNLSIELTPVDVCAAIHVALMAAPGTPPIVVLQSDKRLTWSALRAVAGKVKVPEGREMPHELLADVFDESERTAQDEALGETLACLSREKLAWPEPDEAYLRKFLR